MKQLVLRRRWLAQCATVVAIAGIGGTANAFTLESENADVKMNWDQTLRYNWGQRAQGRDQTGAVSSAVRDESEMLFDRGDTVANRLDLYSEFDLTYQERMGFRVSASLWYDAAYSGKTRSNPAMNGPAFITAPNYRNNDFSPYVKRYYRGPSGEFGDAFVWMNVPTDRGTANVKVGRFGVQWGEAIFPAAAANSVGTSMSPSDAAKAAASPGATAKETLLPLSQILVSLPLSPTLELAAQYSLEYRANRYPEGGTYFGFQDLLLNGPDTFNGLSRIQPQKGRSGDVGLMLKFSPEWLDGVFSTVYRKYDDKNYGWLSTTATTYQAVAARNTELVGVGLNKNVAGVAVGAELSYRKNQGLFAGMTGPAVYTTTGANYEAIPRGNTTHALLNLTKAFGKTTLWDTAILVGEASWSHLNTVTANPATYLGNTLSAAAAGNPSVNCGNNPSIGAGCPSKSASRLDMAFTPTWLQVFPGVDLSLPLLYMRGLSGNAAAFGSAQNEGTVIYSVGLNATAYSKYNFSLAYTGFDNKHSGTGNVTQSRYVNNGITAYYDRAWLNFTFRVTY